jgi:hypothetical protein
MTTIVHLYGAPGAGKSTTAACIFSRLKRAGVNSEIVTEVAKDWCWNNRKIGKYEQVFLPSKQMLKETCLIGKVDVIVTDSPFPLGGFYYSLKYGNQQYEKFLFSLLEDIKEDGNDILSFLIFKKKKHNDSGRVHSEEESFEIERKLKEWLTNNVEDCWTGFDHEDFIFDRILDNLNREI